MLLNHFTVAFRALRRQAGSTALNVVGLALGLACCMVIALFVRHELSFDRFHTNADRIARVSMTWVFDDTTIDVAGTTTKPGPLLAASLPDVESYVRLIRSSSATVETDGRRYREEGLVHADASLFDVFSFPLLRGTAATALTRPHTVVLTESIAQRYFGAADPLGRTIRINGGDPYEVTAVMADVPPNSHLQFDLVASFVSLPEAATPDWNSSDYHTYLLLSSPDALARVRAGMVGVFREEFAGFTNAPRLQLMPLTDVYLRSDRPDEWSPEGDIRRVYVFAGIALLVLLIACINYVNLSTAHAVNRAREVGVRKALGARRGALIAQFMVEALVTTALAFVTGVGLVLAVLPAFSDFSGRALSLNAGQMLVWLPPLWLVVSAMAGLYPAFVLSGFQPIRALRGRSSASRSGTRLRKGLVVAQFVISIFLIVSTLVIERQVRFIADRDLGYDRAHVVALPVDGTVLPNLDALEQDLASSAAVSHVATTSNLPIEGAGVRTFGVTAREEDRQLINVMEVDAGFTGLMGLRLLDGAPLTEADVRGSEETCTVLLNASAVTHFGWTSAGAVGRTLDGQGRLCTVKGVVADFHFDSLHQPIEPLVLLAGTHVRHLLVRTTPGDVRTSLEALGQTWTRHVPGQPFAYSFLDQEYDAVYRSEQRTGQLFSLFSLFAVFIACLGLLGLTAFAVVQRTKEIGIRKVLGATVPDITALLSREFVVLVGAAFTLAAPLAYLAMHRWLEGFAYHVELGPGAFLLAGGSVLVVALLTVIAQALRAATADPVKALRAE